MPELPQIMLWLLTHSQCFLDTLTHLVEVVLTALNPPNSIVMYRALYCRLACDFGLQCFH